MTGFATASRDTPFGQLIIEIRSVNSRFLDLSFRLPDELRAAEWPLRELISGAVLRGKLECRVGLRVAAAGEARIDEQALSRLAALAATVRGRFPQAAEPTIGELLRFPGVMSSEASGTESSEDLLPAVLDCARAALAAFADNRSREGQRLIEAISERARRIGAIVDELQAVGPQLLAAQQARLIERLQAAVLAVAGSGGGGGGAAGGAMSGVASGAAGGLVPVEETMARIRQEVTLHGMRADIAEELDRLRSHLSALAETCSGAGPVGKKLDFLLQEFNREANTLASKGAMPEVGRIAVELKLLIEQIREQVQNLE
jgi:uncharacterized protein YicC (UPF0701 family)